MTIVVWHSLILGKKFQADATLHPSAKVVVALVLRVAVRLDAQVTTKLYKVKWLLFFTAFDIAVNVINWLVLLSCHD